ncbi:MAG: hypothetical protein ABI318_04035, partial [Chthoniobacteraceae bacterium]
MVIAYPNANPSGARGGLIGGEANPGPTAPSAAASAPVVPAPPAAPPPPDTGLQPSWETQKLAR